MVLLRSEVVSQHYTRIVSHLIVRMLVTSVSDCGGTKDHLKTRAILKHLLRRVFACQHHLRATIVQIREQKFVV